MFCGKLIRVKVAGFVGRVILFELSTCYRLLDGHAKKLSKRSKNKRRNKHKIALVAKKIALIFYNLVQNVLSWLSI